jgi:hypothetical protein
MRSHADRSVRRRLGVHVLLAAAAVGAVVAGIAAAVTINSDRPIPRPTGGSEPVAALGLTVSADGRHFVDEAGKPFFLLGDTAWAMPLRLDRDEVVAYLDARAAQGFNVVQTVAIFNQAGGPGPNRYGDMPYSGELTDIAVTDGADPNGATQYDYWDHLDFIVAEAGVRGRRVALVPVWANKQAGSVVTEDNAADYGAYLGARDADDHVIWVMGGDATADGVERVWRELARGVAVGATGREDYSTTLMTYHPLGGSKQCGVVPQRSLAGLQHGARRALPAI